MRWIERCVFIVLVGIGPSGLAFAQDAPTSAAAAEQVLHEVPGLERVDVRRYGKALILDGAVVREADRELAEKIAQANNGGGNVVNQITVSTSLMERVIPTLRISAEKMSRILGSAPLLLVAALVFWLFWRAGRWLSQRAWISRRARQNPFVGELLRQAIRLVMAVTGLLFALEVLDAITLATALLGSAGVAGIALGFAFRDLLENYIAGVLLSLRRPFAPDDVVSIDGHQGVVVGMNSRATLLMTYDGNQLSLPNALVFKSVMINFTSNGRRRFDFVLAVEPSADAALVLREGLQALRSTPDVLAEPAPFVQLAEITREELRVQFFAWVDQRSGNFGNARSEALRAVRQRLHELGVDFRPPALRLIAGDAPLQRTGKEGIEAAAPADAPRGKAPPPLSNRPQPGAAPAAANEATAAPPQQAVAAAVEEARREMGEEDLLKERRSG